MKNLSQYILEKLNLDDDNIFYGNFHNGYEYVDLGLPSGTVWAKYNVGASSEKEIGDYFAWGEIKPKKDYSWKQYKFGKEFDNLTKYCTDEYFGLNKFKDDISQLEMKDDVANKIMGEQWCIPSKQDFEELKKYTEFSWVQNYKNLDVQGIVCKGKNGKEIFFPECGYYDGTDRIETSPSIHIWTCDLNIKNPSNAIDVFAYPRSKEFNIGNDERFYGSVIRPVYK